MPPIVPFAPPFVYEMLRAQYHVAQLEEPVPLDDKDSGYGSSEDDFAQPSLIDHLGVGEGINCHDNSVWSSCQQHSRDFPFVRHGAPFTIPDCTYTKSGPGFGDGTCPHSYHHEQNPYIPTSLPSLGSHIQVNTNNPSSKPPSSTRQSSNAQISSPKNTNTHIHFQPHYDTACTQQP